MGRNKFLEVIYRYQIFGNRAVFRQNMCGHLNSWILVCGHFTTFFMSALPHPPPEVSREFWTAPCNYFQLKIELGCVLQKSEHNIPNITLIWLQHLMFFFPKKILKSCAFYHVLKSYLLSQSNSTSIWVGSDMIMGRKPPTTHQLPPGTFCMQPYLNPIRRNMKNQMFVFV